jgi:tetratricopeptide (TPR) repeat protein
MNRLRISVLLLITIFGPVLTAQKKESSRTNFHDAESWIVYEEYKDALPIYIQLLKSFPENANIKYRIGECYLNLPGEKYKAIPYLEDAVKNIDPSYKEGRFSETGAPTEALYFLANAYRINNQLGKALETYETFRKNLNPSVYDTSTVSFQITTCKNAIDLMNKPLKIKMTNLGSSINGKTSEYNPVISDAEDEIVFSRSTAFYDALLYSVKINGIWSDPLNLNEMLKTDRDIYPSSLSPDGKVLYLYSTADYDGILYTSSLVNGRWQPIVRMNDNINTKYWESHVTVSHDNKKLYFTSNRKGSLGGLDIYVSQKDSTGSWGPAVNLGPVINTKFNEDTPFLSEDDKTLFFSSGGHYNMGGYDIFYSKLLDNGQWSEPVNLGFPVNTTDDDVFFRPVKNGLKGYISRDLSSGMGGQDIYYIELSEP